MGEAIGLVVFVLAIFCLLKFKIPQKMGVSKRFLLFVFALKCFTGTLCLYIYDNHYESRAKADVYKFYDDGVKLAQMYMADNNNNSNESTINWDKLENWQRQYDHGFNNDNKFMIVLNAVLSVVVYKSVWAIMVIVNLIFLIILLALFKQFSISDTTNKWFLFLALLIPSSLFWNSVLLKETIAIIGFAGIYTAVFGAFNNVWRVIVLLFALLIMVSVKVFLLPCLLLVGGIYSINKSDIGIRKSSLKYVICFVGFIFGIWLITQVPIGKRTFEALSFKQKDFKNIAAGGVILKNDTSYCMFKDSQRSSVLYINDSLAVIKTHASFTYFKLPNTKDSLRVHNYQESTEFKIVFDNPKSGSIVYVPEFKSDFQSLMYAMPYALFNTVVRPIPLEHEPLLVTLAGFENLMLLVILLLSIYFRKSKANYNKILALVVLILGIYILIGLTTPVLGAIVRYKTLMLPFVWYVCFLLIDFQKIGKYKGIQWVKSFVLQEQQRV